MTHTRFGLVVALLAALCLAPAASLCQEKGLRPVDPDSQSFGTSSGEGNGRGYAMTSWEKGALRVAVLRLSQRGKGLRPVLMTISRQTLAGGAGEQGAISNDTIDLSLSLGNGEQLRYRFKEGEDARPEIGGKKYRLDQGTLFVIDHGVKPAKVQQLKVDLGKFVKEGPLTQKDVEAAVQGLRAASPAVAAIIKKAEAP